MKTRVIALMTVLSCLSGISLLAEDISKTVFVAFDIETTGFSPKKDAIIEIGAVKFMDSKVLATKTWLINPGRPIPKRASDVHGIDDDMISKEPSFAIIYPEWKKFTQDSVLIAHNAQFDTAFINAEIARNSIDEKPCNALDTLKLARKWYPGRKSYSLKNIATYLNIKGGKYHRALSDAMYVKEIFTAGTALLPESISVEELKSKTPTNP